jgi:2-C-methyl-D-erythritol 2,4-cyclodiphosphate synthase
MIRIGHGYDVHAFTDGDHVVIGGVRIDCDRGVRAHSDGDVVLHALCDALLGAAGLGDIGHHFPDTDPAWRDADSGALLARVQAMLESHAWKVANVDISVIAEKPKLAGHVEAMCVAIAGVLRVPVNTVNVKATTHEGIGALGAGEGLAAHAVVLIEAG